MGRSKSEAGLGIEVAGAGRQAISPDMKSLLDSVFTDNAAEDDMVITRVEGDDYVA
jgi:hypothetical protein